MREQQPKVLVTILNYKTYEMTLKLVAQLKKITYENVDVLVVDNASPNDSAFILNNEAEKEGFVFIANKNNNGYAAGNNVGIKYAVDNGYEYTWILNNDIEITDKNILLKMVNVFQKNFDVACVGQKIFDLNGNICSPYINRPTLWTMTLGLFFEKKNRARYDDVSGIVYRLHGCSMLLKNADMQAVNYMDERTFLYCEEEILAERLLEIGKKSFYTADTSLIHKESSTVGHYRGFGCLNKIKIVSQSMRLYLKEYRKYNCMQIFLCVFFRSILIFAKG